MEDIFGQDIKLDANGQAMVAANGELVLTEGAETGVQDIQIMLETPLGSLFYDKDFGSLVHHWKKEENTLSNRMGFEAEVKRRINSDSRVRFGSASCKIRSWDENGIIADATWQFIENNHVYNFVIQTGDSMEMVMKDVNPY